MEKLWDRVNRREILISDGAMGTFLQVRGLQPGECPEFWCISHPEVVKAVAAAYIAAGSDLVETNSFGANAYKLKPYGVADKVDEINRAAVQLAKQAAPEWAYVAASVGPTGEIVEEEGGTATADGLYQAFREQVVALEEGGADALCIETMLSLTEAVQAVRAAKDHTKLPVICTFTFQADPEGYHTMMGVTPERAATEAVAAGADIVGANCGNGIVNMIDITRRMRAAQPHTPILIHANAGMPVLEGEKTVYKETPEFMASHVNELIKAGANIIGGCCGTTPDHIAAIARVVKARSARV